MSYTFSTQTMTLQEQIWLNRYAKQGDPEALLALLMARIEEPVTANELLYMDGDRMAALAARLSDSLIDTFNGKALIARMGLQ